MSLYDNVSTPTATTDPKKASEGGWPDVQAPGPSPVAQPAGSLYGDLTDSINPWPAAKAMAKPAAPAAGAATSKGSHPWAKICRQISGANRIRAS